MEVADDDQLGTGLFLEPIVQGVGVGRKPPGPLAVGGALALGG